MQDEVLNRMEKKFEQLDHFEKVVTFARQGYGGMTITVKGGTSKADQQEAWYQARKKLTTSSLELPDGVIGPIFNDEYGDVYGLLYAVKGDGIGHAELSDAAEDIKRRLLKVPMVKKVDLIGKQARARLRGVLARAPGRARHHAAGHRRKPEEPERDAARRLRSTPAATACCVRVSGQFANEDDIRNVPIAAGGRTIKLGDIATVKRGFEDPPTYTVRHNGQHGADAGHRR